MTGPAEHIYGKAQLFANSRDGKVIYRVDVAGGLKVLAASDVRDRAHLRLMTKMPVPGTSWPAALSPDGRQLSHRASARPEGPVSAEP